MTVKFHDGAADELLKFAVIISQSDGKWVFCKHRERDTYEIPGGRREDGEGIFETAARELHEETGAVKFTLTPVCAYSATGKNRVNLTGEKTFGIIYFAQISPFDGELHCETERVVLFDAPPPLSLWTYPQIQPLMINEFLRRKNGG